MFNGAAQQHEPLGGRRALSELASALPCCSLEAAVLDQRSGHEKALVHACSQPNSPRMQ